MAPTYIHIFVVAENLIAFFRADAFPRTEMLSLAGNNTAPYLPLLSPVLRVCVWCVAGGHFFEAFV